MSSSRDPYALPRRERRIFCNRTLNLRAIKAIGFDMDYTLVHYDTEAWESRCYSHARQQLLERGWPVGDLAFNPGVGAVGLVVDTERGNLVKANRFGYVKAAAHGSRMLDFNELRALYSRELVDLREPRWVLVNTLFAQSKQCLYAQAVDLLDAKELPEILGYPELFRVVWESVDTAHTEGELKAEIMADPERFVERDPELPLALLDLKHAGKQLLLITNAEWSFVRAMMAYAVDSLLPTGMTWRDLFELTIVASRKPEFFTEAGPAFEILDDAGHLKPVVGGRFESGGMYFGGNAAQVEAHLGLRGEEILYVGDHVYSDVSVSKDLLRWRTALVVRGLESELRALNAFQPRQAELSRLMAEKTALEHRQARLRLERQRRDDGYGPAPELGEAEIQRELQALREAGAALDEQVGPLAQEAATLMHPRWGLLMRTGNDKSFFVRHLERYADVYMSRVSNLLDCTPFAYLRSPRGSLPHDDGTEGDD